MIEAVVAAARRPRARWLAMRGSPLGVPVAGALVVMIVRRRRRRRLETELGPPNESAPGHRVGPAASAPDVPTDPQTAPNEGAAGHEPAQEPAEPVT
ncbi:MAG: hypothetical protein ACJ76S_10575 [Solirubrobacteraceae bacterium]